MNSALVKAICPWASAESFSEYKIGLSKRNQLEFVLESYSVGSLGRTPEAKLEIRNLTEDNYLM